MHIKWEWLSWRILIFPPPSLPARSIAVSVVSETEELRQKGDVSSRKHRAELPTDKESNRISWAITEFLSSYSSFLVFSLVGVGGGGGYEFIFRIDALCRLDWAAWGHNRVGFCFPPGPGLPETGWSWSQSGLKELIERLTSVYYVFRFIVPLHRLLTELRAFINKSRDSLGWSD